MIRPKPKYPSTILLFDADELPVSCLVVYCDGSSTQIGMACMTKPISTLLSQGSSKTRRNVAFGCGTSATQSSNADSSLGHACNGL